MVECLPNRVLYLMKCVEERGRETRPVFSRVAMHVRACLKDLKCGMNEACMELRDESDWLSTPD